MAAVLLKSTRLFKWACAFLRFHFSEKLKDFVSVKLRGNSTGSIS